MSPEENFNQNRTVHFYMEGVKFRLSRHTWLHINGKNTVSTVILLLICLLQTLDK